MKMSANREENKERVIGRIITGIRKDIKEEYESEDKRITGQ